MTLRANKQLALVVAVGGAVIDAVIVIFALLIGPLAMLSFVGLGLVAQVLIITLSLIPLTVMNQGGELVRRSGNKETRVPRSAVARCSLVGAAWVFSDSTGTQLFTLQAIRFDSADVAAFCQAEGIPYDGPSQRPVDVSRGDVKMAKSWIALGLTVTIFLVALTAFGYWLQVRAQNDLARYHAAPACQGFSPQSPVCRTDAQGKVLSTETSRSLVTYHLTLTQGGSYRTSLRNQAGPQVGDVVTVELWNGEVTILEGMQTEDNPERNSNLNNQGLFAVTGLLAAIGVGIMVFNWLRLARLRSHLRSAAELESGWTGPVHQEQSSGHLAIPADQLPPCGIAHHPKEVFFAHWNPKTIRQAMIVTYGIAAAILAILIALAVVVSLPIFGGLALLGVGYFASDQIGEWRVRKISGVYADDLHVAKITNTNWRVDRKVFDRSAVLECVIGTRLSVIGADGSTLFWTTLLSKADVERFVAFLGCRVVREMPTTSSDSLAVPPTPTPIGVLSLRVRRAAGLMQTVAGLLVGLAIINMPLLLPRVPEERRMFAVELLAALGVYGAALFWLGFRLAKGRPRSREAALIGGGLATALFVFAMVVINDQWQATLIFCLPPIGLYGLIYYWLREPEITPSSPPPPTLR